jgi:5'(3')-deoxyribonucleotidase
MLRLAIDMDDVLADTDGKLVRWVRDSTGIVIPPDALVGRDITEVLDRRTALRLKDAMDQPDFFADIPPMAGSREAVRMLSWSYEIFIATAAMEFPNSFTAKFQWLRRYFDFLDPMHFVFCGDKSVLYTHYLIDDNPRHFERFGGEAILFNAPHNALVRGYRRARDWIDVTTMLTPAWEADG